MAGFVRTVLGDVDPTSLGVTYCHEHLLTQPAERFGIDLLLDDEHRAARELEIFRQAGGGTVVELTTPELGRRPAGLRRLSERTGVHIVATTGHVSEQYWRGMLDLGRCSEEALVEEMVVDLTHGMDSTRVRAGIIKIGTSLDQVIPFEARAIRAAGAAQRATGAPITTHTTAGTLAMEQVRLLEEAGADLRRVCIGHLDRRLVWEEHLALARAGVFLGYDQISKEHYQPEAERISFIVQLAAEGFGDRICLGGDLARRSYLEAWGGRPGYRYILAEFLPRLVAAGLGEEAVRALVVDNPAGLLTWAPS
ncbi:MAG: phosphotriesterase family protein [Acidimicrobiia bacterium]